MPAEKKETLLLLFPLLLVGKDLLTFQHQPHAQTHNTKKNITGNDCTCMKAKILYIFQVSKKKTFVSLLKWNKFLTPLPLPPILAFFGRQKLNKNNFVKYLREFVFNFNTYALLFSQLFGNFFVAKKF